MRYTIGLDGTGSAGVRVTGDEGMGGDEGERGGGCNG